MPAADVYEFRFLTRDAVMRGTLEDVINLLVPPVADVDLIDNAMLRLMDEVALMAFDQAKTGDEEYIKNCVLRAGARIAELSALRVRRTKGEKVPPCDGDVWKKPVFFHLQGLSGYTAPSSDQSSFPQEVTVLVPCGDVRVRIWDFWSNAKMAFKYRAPRLLFRRFDKNSYFRRVTGRPIRAEDEG